MKKLYLARTTVSVEIFAGSLLPPNKAVHDNLVWAADEDEARGILRSHHGKDIDPERTQISIWLSEALGVPPAPFETSL